MSVQCTLLQHAPSSSGVHAAVDPQPPCSITNADAQLHKLNMVLLQPSCSVSSADDPYAAFDAEHLFSIILANAQHDLLTLFLLQHACDMSSADDHDIDALVVTAAASMQRSWCR